MPLTLEQMEELRGLIVEAVRDVYDPEIPVNIYDLGLIYGIDLTEAGDVDVQMTLTSPSCPAAESLPPQVEQRIAAVEGVASATIRVVWEPPWNPEMMSEDAKLELNMF
ncbi:MAG: SUF system Fe-S cluster assembly protein [Candidatus Sumerlaeia bacterium]|nr:SUF system Fe-S cluster assembly protein [Candidatus Sumerlaeia bacterium]